MPRKKKEPERRRGAVVVRGRADTERRTEDQELLRSRTPVEFRDTDGNVVANLCATAWGTRFE